MDSALCKTPFTIKRPSFSFIDSSILFLEISKGLTSTNNFLLNGYWQTPKYFNEFEKEIRKDFTFREQIENSDNYIKEMLNDILTEEQLEDFDSIKQFSKSKFSYESQINCTP